MVDSHFILIFLNSYFLGLCAWNALVKCSETERVVLMGRSNDLPYRISDDLILS